jgi:hypothetical protein
MRALVATRSELVLVSGSARLPEAVPSHSLFERLAVVLVLERGSGAIVAADTTLLNSLARAFFRGLVEGLSVIDDVDEIVTRIEDRYFGQTGAALLAAFRHAVETYARA